MEKALIPVSDSASLLVGNVKIGRGARCVLLRRRFGKTLADASAATGMHEHRLSEMERQLREVDPVYLTYIEKLIEEK